MQEEEIEIGTEIEIEEEKEILVVGITGGIGSGKSTVAGIIQNAGYICLIMDDIAKDLMNTSPEIKAKLSTCFGSQMYNNDGTINKDLLSTIVFADTETSHQALRTLNQIVHPYVIDWLIEEIDRLEDEGVEIIFVESALIFELELDEGFDYIIVVDSDENIAIERAMKRTGLSADEVQYRINEQLAKEEKRKSADFIIENNGSLEDLNNATNVILSIISNI